MAQNFGERLKKYRQDRRLTQQELADQIGVSNKTVSRWESEGGYPDVPMLVPLARALGVTVDDLLDGEKPVRTMGKADWQSLLSFAFALGGGVLFFLFGLFMPALLCYLGYLGCMAYGVYLQKYYTFHSKWFFVGNAAMNLAINLSMASKLLPLSLLRKWIAMGAAVNAELSEGSGFELFRAGQTFVPGTMLFLFLLAVGLTVLTQVLIWKWYSGEPLPRLSVRRGKWEWRNLLLPLIPVLATLFWVPYGMETPWPAWVYRAQTPAFLGLLAALALLVLLAYHGRGRRGRLALGLSLCLLCVPQVWLGEVRRAYSIPRASLGVWTEALEKIPARYILFRELTAPALILGGVLLAAGLLGCLLRVSGDERKSGETEE